MSWLLVLACSSSEPDFPPDPAQVLFERLDADGSGSIEPEELAARDPDLVLAVLDVDGEGTLSLGELRADMARVELIDWGSRQSVGPPPPRAGPPPEPGTPRGPMKRGKAPRGKVPTTTGTGDPP